MMKLSNACLYVCKKTVKYTVPSRDPTYPTSGKGKIILKSALAGDMLVPRRVHRHVETCLENRSIGCATWFSWGRTKAKGQLQRTPGALSDPTTVFCVKLFLPLGITMAQVLWRICWIGWLLRFGDGSGAQWSHLLKLSVDPFWTQDIGKARHIHSRQPSQSQLYMYIYTHQHIYIPTPLIPWVCLFNFASHSTGQLLDHFFHELYGSTNHAMVKRRKTTKGSLSVEPVGEPNEVGRSGVQS